MLSFGCVDSSVILGSTLRSLGILFKPIILSPPKNGTKFRYFAIKPTPEGIPREKVEEATARAFELMGAAHERAVSYTHLTLPTILLV